MLVFPKLYSDLMTYPSFSQIILEFSKKKLSDAGVFRWISQGVLANDMSASEFVRLVFCDWYNFIPYS